jgi:hypothetical protein
MGQLDCDFFVSKDCDGRLEKLCKKREKNDDHTKISKISSKDVPM